MSLNSPSLHKEAPPPKPRQVVHHNGDVSHPKALNTVNPIVPGVAGGRAAVPGPEAAGAADTKQLEGGRALPAQIHERSMCPATIL